MTRTGGHLSPYSKLQRNLRRLGATMLFGAITDLVIALVALLVPSWVAQFMGDAVTGASLSLQFWPVVHLVFPCFYLLAWMDPKRNVVIVAGAIMARLIYAVFMVAAGVGQGIGLVWLFDGGISLFLAVAHYVHLRRSDFGLWEVLIRAGNPPGLRE